MAYQANYPDMADEAEPKPTGDEEEKPEGDSPGDGQEGEDDEDTEDSGEESALIPKSLLAGKDFEPGEEVVFQIVKMRGDEVEIKYATDKGEEDSEMSKADGKLAKMGGY